MHTIDLAGQWTLVREKTGEEYPMSIPGDNMSALLAAGAIPDPYYGQNELLVQWVGGEDWRFEREFEVDAALLSDERARAAMFLHIESVDTVAELRLNGTPVGSSDNMFVRRRFPVGEAVRAGTNTLAITVRSPERAAQEANERLPYPLPYSVYPIQSPHRNLLRKVQCHAGWDWGPCLMVSGLYGEIYLGAPGSRRIEYVTTRQRRVKGNSWEVDVTVELLSARGGTESLRASLSGPQIDEVSESATIDLPAGAGSAFVTLRVEKPQLWWPSGYGAQPLYELSVELDEEVVTKRIGFRELETVVEDDERGRSMLFRLNGRELFCKGANWIPADALPSRHTEEVYRRLLESAREANMNMIRVWGGGQYESDRFYEICDELGILIWHDFMFSCSTYPADRPFLAKVREEVSHQVKRLKDHPSIALWCGNNENLGALTWFPETRRFRDRYVVDYDRLYESTIGDLCEALDPDRTFWPSSPSGGRGDYSDNWHDDTKGDMHYWSVWHEGKPFDSYYEVTPRFCSEFGYQSFPSLSAVEDYAPEGQRNLTAPVMEHHQKNERGNTIIIESLSRYFRFPDGLANMLYLSQVQQAFAIRTAVEYWRSQRPVCMGALYWQLNDNWPVASWASIEYSGKWKLLHYAARRFFSPLHVAGFMKEGSLEIWVCNDTAEAKNGECTLSFVDFEGKTVEEERIRLEVPPDASRRAREYPLGTLPVEPEKAFLVLNFRASGQEIANESFLTYPKLCDIRKAEVKSEVGVEGDSFVVTLSCDHPAFYVSLDAGSLGGRFDDNCITLLPGAPRRLRFRPDAPEFAGRGPTERDAALFGERLSLHHLAASYL